MIRLRYLATITNSNVDKLTSPDEEPVRLCNYVDVYKNDRITNEIEFMSASATPTEITKFRLRVGDVLITKDSEDRKDIAVPAYVAETAPDLVCGYHLALLRARPQLMRGNFLFWALQSKQAQDAFSNAAGGVTRFGLTLDGIKSVPLPCPDRETQKTIADFLDRETARIDQLVEKKQRLIELLREKDKATIKLYVLGQYGERVKIPNDVPWLPGLPEEWPLRRCAHIFRNLDSRRIPLNSVERADLEKVFPYYGASGIIDYVDRYIFDEDNILVGEDGANLVMQSTPIAFKATGKYWVNNHAHILHPRWGCLDFWVHLLNQMPYEIFVTGSAQPKLTSEALGNIRLPCPPAQEQKVILSKLEFIRKNLVAVQQPIKASIRTLREFRASLITAAVTGQIDVVSWGKKGQIDLRLDQIEEAMNS